MSCSVLCYSQADYEEEQVLLIVEQMPAFPGGEEGLGRYISQNLKYPEKAEKEKVMGKVKVQFIVNKKGKAIKAKIIQSVSPELDNEALRIVENMPTWKPGMQDGKPVNVQFILPINFTLKGVTK